jgi:citrate synthase
METIPRGEKHAIYEFNKSKDQLDRFFKQLETVSGIGACYQLIASLAVIAAAIARLHKGKMPVDPDPSLSHAGNFLYMMTGSRPTPVEERIMDIALILHADHGMNASTFATLVTASTLSDLYLSVGSGIAALSGPLHGGANEQVVIQLQEIGDPANVKAWVKDKISKKEKISGFGHRVYKAYDPRARILGPLAAYLADKSEETQRLYATACELEKEVGKQFGSEKKIFPNVDFYSGIVYYSLGIAPEMFTPIFAVSRVSGWTARTLEYLQNNRIFRPRAMYSGEFGKKYVPLEQR